MKLSISNIAWKAHEDTAAAEALLAAGFKGVEIAPTRVWNDPLAASAQNIAQHRAFWQSRGLSVTALQSLLFGHPELTLFESAAVRARTLDYLKGMIRLGADLGAGILVFGSPKNRQRGSLPLADAQAIAADFFQVLGNFASSAGVCFCIEPNPPFYDCDFTTTTAEGRALVERVRQPGFGLHVDAAAMTLAGETPAALAQAGSFKHFHASEKNLAPLGADTVDHAAFARELVKLNYSGWVSVEMRAASESNLPAVQKALSAAAASYG